MSYLCGFSRLRIGDEDTQRMARGEDNVGGHVDEGMSSTSSEDIHSRVDATRVITWLKLVRKSWTYAFWKKNFLSSQGLGFFFFLGISFYGMYGAGPRWNEFHLLVGDSYK